MSPLRLTSAATPPRIGRHPFRLLKLLALVGLGTATAPRAQPSHIPASDGIGFVRLLFTAEGATVLDVTTRPGRLKQRRGSAGRGGLVPKGSLGVEVRTAQGVLVWAGAVADPLLERLEFVNEDGELETRFVPHEQAEVTVRIPAVAPRQTVTFFRAEGTTARTAIADVEVGL